MHSNRSRPLTDQTLAHYGTHAQSYRNGTQLIDSEPWLSPLLSGLRAQFPAVDFFRVLDVGCGPGRDLVRLLQSGHHPVGIDGAPAMIELARSAVAGCHRPPDAHVLPPVDLLDFDAPSESFDGALTNQVLFHVPRPALPLVVKTLLRVLVVGGILLSREPTGRGAPGMSMGRYHAQLSAQAWRQLFLEAGFVSLPQALAPPGNWCLSLWQRPERSAT